MALIEGWWKKKGKSHSLKKDKPRYYILVSDHLDWYAKPGSDRTGSIPLERLYIRMSPDKNSMVVGDQGTNKEYHLTSDGHDNAKRVKEWYDKITTAVEACREKKKHAPVSRPPLTSPAPQADTSFSAPDSSQSNQPPQPQSQPQAQPQSQVQPPTGPSGSSTLPYQQNPYANSSQTVTHQHTEQMNLVNLQAQQQAQAQAKLNEANMIAQAQANTQAQAQMKLNEVSMNATMAGNAALQATQAAQELAVEAARQQALADAALERARQVTQANHAPSPQIQGQYNQTVVQSPQMQQQPQYQQPQYTQTMVQSPQIQPQVTPQYTQTTFAQPQPVQYTQTLMPQVQPQYTQTYVQPTNVVVQPAYQPTMTYIQPQVMQPVYVQPTMTYVQPQVVMQPMYTTVYQPNMY